MSDLREEAVWRLVNDVIGLAERRCGATRMQVVQALLGIGIADLGTLMGKERAAQVLRGLADTLESEKTAGFAIMSRLQH